MFNFEDAPQTKERQSGTVPPGVYKATIVDIDFKPTNKGGSMWAVTLQTDEGKVWMNYTHDNSNEQAVEIGRGGFSDFLFAASIPLKFESLQVLQGRAVNKELLIEVSNEDEGGGKLRSLVAAAYKVDGSHRAGEKRNLNPIVLGPNGKKPFKGKKAAGSPQATSSGDLPF